MRPSRRHAVRQASTSASLLGRFPVCGFLSRLDTLVPRSAHRRASAPPPLPLFLPLPVTLFPSVISPSTVSIASSVDIGSALSLLSLSGPSLLRNRRRFCSVLVVLPVMLAPRVIRFRRASPLLRPLCSSAARNRVPSIRDITPDSAAQFNARQKEFREKLEAARKRKEQQESQSAAASASDSASSSAPVYPRGVSASLPPLPLLRP